MPARAALLRFAAALRRLPENRVMFLAQNCPDTSRNFLVLSQVVACFVQLIQDTRFQQILEFGRTLTGIVKLPLRAVLGRKCSEPLHLCATRCRPNSWRLALFEESLSRFAPLLREQGYVSPPGEPPQERRRRIESGAGYARPLAIQMEALLWLASVPQGHRRPARHTPGHVRGPGDAEDARGRRRGDPGAPRDSIMLGALAAARGLTPAQRG